MPSLKQDAAGAAMAIAQKVAGSPDEVQKLMTQIGQPPVKVEIVKAEYGAGDKVQGRDRDRPQGGRRACRWWSSARRTTTRPSAATRRPNVPKQLKIQYKIDGKPGEVTLPENATILLPMPK